MAALPKEPKILPTAQTQRFISETRVEEHNFTTFKREARSLKDNQRSIYGQVMVNELKSKTMFNSVEYPKEEGQTRKPSETVSVAGRLRPP